MTAALLWTLAGAEAQTTESVVDIPTRPGISQRMIVIAPSAPRAAVVLFPGGHGGLQLSPNGSMKWGDKNFLVRTRQLFADRGLMVAVLDAPSDRQTPPFLRGFRQKPEHVADVKAVVGWLRDKSKMPVWLIGTSRGTQSAAYVMSEWTGADAPDGLVLTSTIVADDKGRAVPAMPLGNIRAPVLVVHHRQDGCAHCPFAEVPLLMRKVSDAARSQLLAVEGGENRGDPCEAMAYHGFNGIEQEVVRQTVDWILAK